MKNTNLIIVITLAAFILALTALIVRSDYDGAIDIQLGVEGIKYRMDGAGDEQP